jgi:hypothetical protein
MPGRRRFLKVLGSIVVVLLVGVGILVLTQRHAPPEAGVTGAEADAIAHAVEKAAGVEAFNKLGAIRWTWSGSGKTHHLVWDKKRNTANVQWKGYEAHLDVAHATGKVFDHGVEQTGDAAKPLLETAMKIFYNDSFWLNPLAKLFDEGVTREKVTVDGKPALFVKYASGGVTPGDKYLWMLGDDGMPKAWRVWVSVIKLGGLQISWDDWTTLPGGARVATMHKIVGLPGVKITDLAAADTYEQLPK